MRQFGAIKRRLGELVRILHPGMVVIQHLPEQIKVLVECRTLILLVDAALVDRIEALSDLCGYFEWSFFG